MTGTSPCGQSPEPVTTSPPGKRTRTNRRKTLYIDKIRKKSIFSGSHRPARPLLRSTWQGLFCDVIIGRLSVDSQSRSHVTFTKLYICFSFHESSFPVTYSTASSMFGITSLQGLHFAMALIDTWTTAPLDCSNIPAQLSVGTSLILAKSDILRRRLALHRLEFYCRN